MNASAKCITLDMQPIKPINTRLVNLYTWKNKMKPQKVEITYNEVPLVVEGYVWAEDEGGWFEVDKIYIQNIDVTLLFVNVRTWRGGSVIDEIGRCAMDKYIEELHINNLP
jgi:hypothetical protein